MKTYWTIFLCLTLIGICGCSQQALSQAQGAAADVRQYVGANVQELYEAIGQPQSSEYQDSCAVANAQDGFLYYDGFIVVTLKTAEQEVIQSIQ